MAHGLDAFSVAERLEEIGRRLELRGESPFKVRAYAKSAGVLRALKIPLHQLIAEERLRDLPGVGKAIAEKIVTLQRTGTHPVLEQLRREVPGGLLDLTRLPGLGVKKVLQIRKELGVEDLDALEAAAKSGKLARVSGLGDKLQAKLLAALDFARNACGKMRLHEADAALDAARAELEPLGEAHPAGEARRRCETVAEACLVLVPRAGQTPPMPDVPARGAKVRVISAPPEHSAAALLYATGNAAHLRALEKLAAEKGLRLTPEGLFRGKARLPSPGEAALYGALGLPFIAPELREGRGEIEAAKKGALPKLLEPGAIRGILHCHTAYSDGANTLEEMAEAVRGMGMQYFGVADHSQSAAYAGGLKEERVLRQHRAVDERNARYAKEGRAFRIFKGIESDIRADGSLDYPDALLARFDFIVASVHSRFELSEAEQTARVIRAVSHPAVTILGHPTGRLLLRRPPYAINLERVIEACAEHGVAIEINAHPVRLDLDWRWHERARAAGAIFSINPDAHHSAELPLFRYGVSVARKGGLDAGAILNALDLAAFTRHLEARKQRFEARLPTD